MASGSYFHIEIYYFLRNVLYTQRVNFLGNINKPSCRAHGMKKSRKPVYPERCIIHLTRMKAFVCSQLLRVSTVFSSIAQVMTLSLISQAKVWVSFAFNFVWAVILISSAYIMLKCGMGTIALAWANVIAYSLHCVLQFIYVEYGTKSIQTSCF